MASQTLMERWKELSPGARSGSILGIGSVLVLVGMYVFTGSANTAATKKPTVDETRFVAVNGRDISAEQNEAKTKALTDQIAQMQDHMTKLESDNIKMKEQEGKAPVVDPATNSRLDQLATQLAEMSSKKAALDKPLPPPVAVTIPPPMVADSPVSENPQKETASDTKIRVIGGASASKKSEKVIPSEKIAYLPSGSMFEVVLLNGMDAATNAVAQKNPVPALTRIKADAILPNFFVHDVKECFVLVAGYGSLSSERALMRTETLSCIRESGQVIEAKIDGYVVGEDGRVGLRGRLVSKQGQLIAKSLAAGVLSGFGQAIMPTSTPGLNLNSGTSYQMPDPAAVAGSAISRGFSDASKSAAQFFLEMAKEMTPVVEIDAGRKVTIILTKGVELK